MLQPTIVATAVFLGGGGRRNPAHSCVTTAAKLPSHCNMPTPMSPDGLYSTIAAYLLPNNVLLLGPPHTEACGCCRDLQLQ